MHWIKTVTSDGGDIEKLCFDSKICLKTEKLGLFVDPAKPGDPDYRHCRQDSWVSLLNIQPLSLQKYKSTKTDHIDIIMFNISLPASMFCQWWVSLNIFRNQAHCDLISMFIVHTCQIPNNAIVIFFRCSNVIDKGRICRFWTCVI